MIIPERLAAACREITDRAAWLERLPKTLHQLQRRWSLTLGLPFDGPEVSCSWVAPATRADGTPAVLKLGMPHMEGRDELAGLHFWDGDPTVRLLEADDDLNAMLLERCEPGTPLRALPEREQDLVIAGLLRRLWRSPPEPHPFRSLSAMLAQWSAETLADAGRWPFVGDPAHDATQHLLNCDARLRSEPDGTIQRFADLLGLDPERIRLWTFARAAAEPRSDWDDANHRNNLHRSTEGLA